MQYVIDDYNFWGAGNIGERKQSKQHEEEIWIEIYNSENATICIYITMANFLKYLKTMGYS